MEIEKHSDSSFSERHAAWKGTFCESGYMFMRAEESGRGRFCRNLGANLPNYPTHRGRPTAEWYPKDNVFFCPPPPSPSRFERLNGGSEGESGWLEERSGSGTQPHELSIVIFS